jgi:ribosomal-protein-alanine N-acetyltransferase
VRRGRRSDAPELAALGASAFARGWSADSIAAELEQPGAEIWVLRGARPRSGFLIARHVPGTSAGSAPGTPAGSAGDQLEVLLLAVAADERRAGGASALLATALTAARQAGLAGSQLEVRASNAAAIALYRRHGFADVGRRPRYYEGREDAVLMSLEFAPETREE